MNAMALSAAKLFRDTWLIFQQEVQIMSSNLWVIVVSLAQPVTFLVLFAPFLKAAMAGQGVTSYADAYRIYVPGLFVAMGLFGGLFAGFGLLSALRAGIIDRCRVTPISRTALLLGRSMIHVFMNVIQAAIITVLALPLGLRVPPLNLLLAYLLLATMMLLTTTISYNIALLVRNENSISVTVNTVAQPVSLLAGVLVPLALAPLWVQQVALWNPFAWATSGIRALFNDDIGNPAAWQGGLVIAGLCAANVLWSSRLFQRDVS
jgi:ABC-2 type transport system permease protein